jgi:hypothetical protein
MKTLGDAVAATLVVDACAAVAAIAEVAKIDPAALSDTIAEIMILRPLRMIPP